MEKKVRFVKYKNTIVSKCKNCPIKKKVAAINFIICFMVEAKKQFQETNSEMQDMILHPKTQIFEKTRNCEKKKSEL